MIMLEQSVVYIVPWSN